MLVFLEIMLLAISIGIISVELRTRFELATYSLQKNCTTNCANAAYCDNIEFTSETGKS